MAKKQKIPDSLPSKAYLVSFGDTMTALLAFFIVLNSLAKEQTGANMYAGTGSFASAFSSSGVPGGLSTNRSADMIQQKQQAALYALADNLDKNEDKEDKVGPDDSNNKDRIVDREKEEFQKFLSTMEKRFGLEKGDTVTNQIVFDSFASFDVDDGSLSAHALQLVAEIAPKLRRDQVRLEVIIWATMPSRSVMNSTLMKSRTIKSQIESSFWLKPKDTQKIRYVVKPWLFADAKRPVISFVVSESSADSPQ